MVDKLQIYVCPVQRCAVCSLKPDKKCPKHFNKLKPEGYVRAAAQAAGGMGDMGGVLADMFKGKVPPR